MGARGVHPRVRPRMNSLEQRAAGIMEMGKSAGIKAILALIREQADIIEAGYETAMQNVIDGRLSVDMDEVRKALG